MIDLSKPIIRKRRGFTAMVQSLDRRGFWIALALAVIVVLAVMWLL